MGAFGIMVLNYFIKRFQFSKGNFVALKKHFELANLNGLRSNNFPTPCRALESTLVIKHSILCPNNFYVTP